MEQTITNSTIAHKSYHHIINSKVNSFIRKFDYDSLVIVEEKIDGSNFYFASNGVDSVCGRKNDQLVDTEYFYDFQKITHLKKNIIELHKKLSITNSIKDLTIYLYGELIPTQTRIKYVTDKQIYFIAFDLKIVSANIGNEITTTWLSKNEWSHLATDCGFIVNPTIFKGKLIEALKFDVENTKSIVPFLLKSDSDYECIIEGVVIKGENFTVKKKSHAFREMESGGGVRFGKTKDPNETAVGELLGEMLTISRLENIISQIGDKMVPDAHRLSNTVVLDAIQEARDDEDCVIYQITKSKVCKIQKQLAIDFTETVKQHMKW